MIINFQEKLLASLNNASSLKTTLRGIYFQVPASTNFPYICLSDFVVKDISTKSQVKSEIGFKINLYSRDKSFKNVYELVEHIKLEVKNNDFKSRLYEERFQFLNDGITKQIILFYKVRLNNVSR